MHGYTLHIRQNAPVDGKSLILLTLKRPRQPDLEAEASIEFALTPQEQEDIRWYMEDYLQRAEAVEDIQVKQIEHLMQQCGEELYRKVLTGELDQQAIWFAIREQLADLRVEITAGIAEAASIPWELMRDPESDSAIALRVKEFVRVEAKPNVGFVPAPSSANGRVRLLYVVCRPSGTKDVSLRAIANRLLQGLGKDIGRFDITALRPPTFEQLQRELTDAKEAGRPYHIVHFDGHGMYADLKHSKLAAWVAGHKAGEQGYLLFEHPSVERVRPVSGDEFGKLLHDSDVPILVLNACQSAMHRATEKPRGADDVRDEVRAIGSLAQAVVGQGIPAVLGMRYSVYVVTAAQYIGQLYKALAKGRGFGQAATEARKHLHRKPERWVGLQPRPLQDWFVPVVYEAARIELFPQDMQLSKKPELDPVQLNQKLLRYVPDSGFIGRDETLLMLDRAFDAEPVVLLHAYAGQGKTTTAVEFARWYAQTGGLTSPKWPQPIVLFTSFESHTDLTDVLNEIGQQLIADWSSINEMDEKRRLVFQVLREVPLLWIWDNVEPVAGFPAGTESQWTQEEQQDLADFLKQLKRDRATKVKLLLTSRRDEQPWLGGIPHRVKMPRMSAADAANLALQLGKEKKVKRSEIAKWQSLLDYCRGNPMTLRVLVGQAVKENRRSEDDIKAFVDAIQSGEKDIQDEDKSQGRDKSLGASLDYGFRHAFTDDELPIIALLHLFQGTVDVRALQMMGESDHALPEVQGKSNKLLAGLLQRAGETGLLTHLGSTRYAIHPALPWFLRQLFARHYDGQSGRSSAEAALRAWVEAVGELGNYYHDQFIDGNRDVIQFLALEEANLLHARRSARRHEWWSRVASAMQGLRGLYQFQGRASEWARLVAEIVPDYCTEDDEPVAGREDEYSVVIGYRVGRARLQERDLARAAALQGKLVAWNRQQAAAALALPEDASLDDEQRNLIRTLGVNVCILGQILFEQGSGDCVEQYEESIRQYQRIKDTAVEAISYFNLGRAYHEIPGNVNLDAAEAAYERARTLYAAGDKLNRAAAIKQIGMVHHQRFDEARHQDEPPETVLQHARAAEQHYLQALDLCPASAIADLGPFHNQLGILYKNVGQTEQAREHYEKSAQYFEQTGNRYNAGSTRFNMALMYMQAAGGEESQKRQRDGLLRARAYAQAALRDYQHYEGRAAADEAKAQQLIDMIEQQLAELPQ